MKLKDHARKTRVLETWNDRIILPYLLESFYRCIFLSMHVQGFFGCVHMLNNRRTDMYVHLTLTVTVGLHRKMAKKLWVNDRERNPSLWDLVELSHQQRNKNSSTTNSFAPWPTINPQFSRNLTRNPLIGKDVLNAFGNPSSFFIHLIRL